MRLSLYAFYVSCALILATAFLYFPKWKEKNSNATISWDVSGYYLYLPGAIIYGDLKHLGFLKDINARYGPDPSNGQAFKQPSGNFVLKYPMGQALQMLPWFLTAHVLARPLGYPADGYSLPYQAALSWGSILIAFLGLWFFRRVLLEYFPDGVAAATLLCFVWGTNYLEYTAVTGAMTHNWLSTLYALLIFLTIRFYKKPTRNDALLIGLLVGWATLTRPTEIVTALIPLLWGVASISALQERIRFFRAHSKWMLYAALAAGAIAMLQPLYWKWASGSWVVYTYQEQGFSWLHPHIRDVLISAKAGWWVYSPILFLVVPGFYLLRKEKRDLFPVIALICLLSLYITSAWDIWWYGGSLGQRALIQSYPLWAFPFAAFVQWTTRKRVFQLAACTVFGLCIYLNLWWTHQAHKGGFFIPEEMNTPYLKKVLGRFDVDREQALKVLDAREEYPGAVRGEVTELLFHDFEKDTSGVTTDMPIRGEKSAILTPSTPYAAGVQINVPPAGFKGNLKWLRAEIWYVCSAKEWDDWKMTQFTVRFSQKDGSGVHKVKESMIRLQRFVEGNELKMEFFDVKMPEADFNQITVFCFNPGSETTVRLDDLRVEVFE